MILADTSVWIDHLRLGDAALAASLDGGLILAHPFVTGEIALGRLRHRNEILAALAKLPQAMVATDDEVLRVIGDHALDGLGIGYIDAHLLASARLSAAALWTHDQRLHAAAVRLQSGWTPPQ